MGEHLSSAKRARTRRLRRIERVLAGEGSYDSLSGGEQAVVRASWDERVAGAISRLDFEAEFTAAGERWSEADAAGDVVFRGAGH